MIRFLPAVLLAARAFAQDDLERVFHFDHISAAQSMHEIGTLVKVMAGIEDLLVDAEGRKITFRGTAAQGKLADWLMIGIDQRAADETSPRIFESQLDPQYGENVVKMFYLKNTNAGQELQELATLVRSLTGIRRLITYTFEPSITVRSTLGQTALAEWLVIQLDKPLKRELEYRVSGGDDDVVRLFPVPGETPQQLQRIAQQVRTETHIPRVLTYPAIRVLALRGTVEQLAQAKDLIYRNRL